MYKVLTCMGVQHDLRLVVLAGVVCLLACFAAVDLRRRARWSSGLRRLVWIATAGAAGGCGVWATHFIAVLAYQIDFPVGYDSGLTALSLFAAVATMTLGLCVGASGEDRWRVAAGGAIIGSGVGLMHYLGMWALVLPGRIEWSMEFVVASLACGVLFASAAIFVLRLRDTWRNAISASLLLTLAIVGLHFTAMTAVRIVPDPTRVIDASSFSSVTLALGIAGVAVAVLAMSLMGAMVDRKLAGQAKQFQLLLQSNPVPMLVLDKQTLTLLAVNAAAVERFGYSQEQFLSMSLLDIRPAADHAEAWEIAWSDEELMHRGLNWRLVKANGEPVEVAVYSRALRYAGRDARIAAIFDITERKRNEERIAYLAHHDVLTGLPNRSAFNERLPAAIENAKAANRPLALLCFDLDRFKDVNDVFGHAVGDKLLCEASKRFAEAAEGGFLARVGGDEFALISTGGRQPDAASDLADRLLESVESAFEIDGRQLKIGLSIGVAIYPDYDSVETLLANADAALYRAKGHGGGKVCFFDVCQDARLRERHSLLQDLGRALERNELQLHYQPQADTEGSIIGFEALLRWIHPQRGMIPPDAFIPLAEETGLILPIGAWVLREACREASSWERPLNIAVNLSPIQFRLDDLPQRVHAVLFETGLSAVRLELEITEGILVDDLARAQSILRQLKCLGVRVSMDDFGTGYSSLSYLQAFPFDKIKIDRSFVSSLFSKPQSEAIVRAIIGLGRGLGLPVIAEGVETEDQLAFLTNEGCTEAQGYLIGRPRLICEYAQFIANAPPPRIQIAMAS
jgi:diguanylate cyclase (GGDEF)-like protein/PAS domain S-box-containing protein